MTAFRSILIALAFAAVACPAVEAGETQPVGQDKQRLARMEARMTFRLGRREGTAGCGADCAEFVYAEGTIYADSARLYAAALAATKKKDLPVYFSSPGGSMNGGMALGRVMRRNGATAVVATMNPADCGQGATVCSPQDKWAGVTVFKAETEKAYCNSACAWAIVGAKTRSLAPGSSFGVHQFYQAENTGDKPNPLAKYSYAQLQDVQRTSGALVNYLVEMGVSPELFSVAASVPATSVRALSASELARYKVVEAGAKPFALPDLKLARAAAPPPAATQRFAAWTLAAAGKDTLLSAEIARQSAKHGAVTTRLALGCTKPDGNMALRLEETSRRSNAPLAPAMMFIGVADRKLAIVNPATDASAERKLIDAAAAAGTLELRLLYSAGLLAGIDARDAIDLKGAGLADALAAMDKACGAAVATIAPAQTAVPPVPPRDIALAPQWAADVARRRYDDWIVTYAGDRARAEVRFSTQSRALRDIESTIIFTCRKGVDSVEYSYRLTGARAAELSRISFRFFGLSTVTGATPLIIGTLSGNEINELWRSGKVRIEIASDELGGFREFYEGPSEGFYEALRFSVGWCRLPARQSQG